MPTRRSFLGVSLASRVLAQEPSRQPWYARTMRWGQTNITENDPPRYDIGWWRGFWRRTQVQGVILNVGGIVAYYPSKFPLHQRAAFLGERDLVGDLTKAAREDGLVVLARMDSNRAGEAFFKAQPSWFCVDAAGVPYRAAEKYISCINGPYYRQYLPDVMREVIDRYHPDGFTDNSWAGLPRQSICHCASCKSLFRAFAGADLPVKSDWNDRSYRQWIDWSYTRRLELWDLNNRVTRTAGGANCIWAGMISANITSMARSFRDCRELARRTPIVMLDFQYRNEDGGWYTNADAGGLLRGVVGPDKLIPESMPMYQMAGGRSFRLSSKPAVEARSWMISGFAGGIQPWWHYISAYHEDRRMYSTAEPVMRWYKEHESLMVGRQPQANIGIAWSQRNTDFHGRNNPEELVDAPFRGFCEALLKGRIPYIPVHIDDLERSGLKVLVLPNLAVMSMAQCAAVRRFVERGGGLIATGVTSMCDDYGDPLGDFRLADLFGTHLSGKPRIIQTAFQHSYLRMTPELRGGVDGPKVRNEPTAGGRRHAVLAGFDETDVLPFGGLLEPMKIDTGRTVPLTFIPPFPIFPPEQSFMKTAHTDIPALVLGNYVAFLPAEIDRMYARHHLPDHAALLANLVRWAAGDAIPLRVAGPGLVGCYPYRQGSRLILHLLNYTNPGSWRAPMDELYPVGPLTVEWRVPLAVTEAHLLVAGKQVPVAMSEGTARFTIDSVSDHEVVVLS